MITGSGKRTLFILLFVGINILTISNSASQTGAPAKDIKSLTSHNDSVLFNIMERFLVASNYLSKTGNDDELKNHTLDSVITAAHLRYLPRSTKGLKPSVLTRYNQALLTFEKMTRKLLGKTTCKLSTATSAAFMQAYIAVGSARDELLQALP